VTQKRRKTMTLKGSRTEKNLLAAFAGESQARNRYTYFSSQAAKDGFMQISSIFEETANQEREHAKRFFRALEGGEVEIQATFPAGRIGGTAENLAAAAGGERHEWTALYPGFARTARDEGFEEVALLFESILVAEKQHEKRYRRLLENVQQGGVFQKAEPVVWRCRNCGYVHTGMAAPDVCPACAHPRAYFELLGENW
jgi:rubrerythrin